MKKPLASIFFGILSLSSTYASTEITGTFSCLLNKSLTGFESSFFNPSNVMKQMAISIDFDKGGAEVILLRISDYGGFNASLNNTQDIAKIYQKDGPIDNSKIITMKFETIETSFLALTVNSANTLMVSYPYGVSGAEPASGVCQRN